MPFPPRSEAARVPEAGRPTESARGGHGRAVGGPHHCRTKALPAAARNVCRRGSQLFPKSASERSAAARPKSLNDVTGTRRKRGEASAGASTLRARVGVGKREKRHQQPRLVDAEAKRVHRSLAPHVVEEVRVRDDHAHDVAALARRGLQHLEGIVGPAAGVVQQEAPRALLVVHPVRDERLPRRVDDAAHDALLAKSRRGQDLRRERHGVERRRRVRHRAAGVEVDLDRGERPRDRRRLLGVERRGAAGSPGRGRRARRASRSSRSRAGCRPTPTAR